MKEQQNDKMMLTGMRSLRDPVKGVQHIKEQLIQSSLFGSSGLPVQMHQSADNGEHRHCYCFLNSELF